MQPEKKQYSASELTTDCHTGLCFCGHLR